MARMLRYEQAGAVFTEDCTSLQDLRDRGTVTGTPTIVGSARGRAIDFSGTAQFWREDIGNFRSQDSAGTISAWIYRDALGGIDGIVTSADTGSSNRYIVFFVGTNNLLGFVQSNADTAGLVYGDTVIPATTWTHVVVTSTGSAWALYVNGTAETLSVSSGTNNGDWFSDTANRDNICIGATKRNIETDHLAGSIREVQIYDRALSATEVSQLYNDTVFDYDLTEVSRWDMSNVNAPDLSFAGNGYDMTGTGLVASTDLVTGPYGGIATEYNGSDEYSSRAVAGWRSSDSTGSIVVHLKLNATGGTQVLFASSDTSANNRLQMRINPDDKLEVFFQDVPGGVADRCTGSTVMVANRWYCVVLASDDTAWSMIVDGLPETIATAAGTNSGRWTSDITSADNISIGAAVGSVIGSYLSGAISDVIYYSQQLTPLQAADLCARLKGNR